MAKSIADLFRDIKNRIVGPKEAATETDQPELKAHADTARTKRIQALGTRRIPKLDTYEHGSVEDMDTVVEPLFVERTRPHSFVLSVIFTVLKLMLVFILVCASAGFGVVMGIARAYVETAPDLDVADLSNAAQTSYIYDMNGDLITTFAGTENRESVSIKEIPDMLKNAFIAVEDVRFYKHNGIDYKRLFSAVINAVRNEDTHGGSTITQQLIKNTILSSEVTYKRKIQEAYLALQLESAYSKDQILEAYLNNIHLGESDYGVKAAAADYFGKELSELTVRECAMLAGITQNPYRYNPRKNMYQRDSFAITNERTDGVLKKMYEAGFITKDQYESALVEDVNIVPTSTTTQMYDMAYFVEYSIYDVVSCLLEKRQLQDTKQNRSDIENELRTGGYSIYTTVDPDIQKTVEDTLINWDKYPKMRDPDYEIKIEKLGDGSTLELQEPQAAAVVIDQSTGQVRALVGGRYQPPAKKLLNRAYQSAMPVGSSIKPLTVYGPALDLGLSPASTVYNFPVAIEGYGGTNGYPGGNSSKYYGPVTMRTGIVRSLNIVAARLLFGTVTVNTAVEYLKNLGIDEARINADGPGLVLGTTSITPLEMAAAYAAIANKGEYQEPISFTKVVDSNGNIVIDATETQTKKQVYQQSSAYMLTDMLTTAVRSGTGTNAQINGITVAGKTGTNDDYRSVYFAGMTGYYTASVWIGHDDYTPQLKSGATGGDYAATLWQAFMSKIHEGLQDKAIIEDSPESLGLVKARICRVSGKLATDACEHDALGLTPTTDWFLNGTAPTETCDMHIDANICNASGKLATGYCPTYQVSQGSMLLVPKDSELYSIGRDMVLKYLTHATFSDLSVTQIENLTPTDADYYKYYCDVHGANSGTYNWQYMYSQASADVTYAQTYLVSNGIQGTAYMRISEAINQVANAMNDAAMDYNALTAAVINLRNVFYSETGENIR